MSALTAGISLLSFARKTPETFHLYSKPEKRDISYSIRSGSFFPPLSPGNYFSRLKNDILHFRLLSYKLQN